MGVNETVDYALSGWAFVPLAMGFLAVLVWFLREIYESTDMGRERRRVEESKEQFDNRKILREFKEIEQHRPHYIVRSDHDEWRRHERAVRRSQQ